MSSANDTPTANDSMCDEIADQQLASKISDELVSKQFTTEAKKSTLATKIATGQMKAEDWRILADSSLRAVSTTAREEKSIDVNGGTK